MTTWDQRSSLMSHVDWKRSIDLILDASQGVRFEELVGRVLAEGTARRVCVSLTGGGYGNSSLWLILGEGSGCVLHNPLGMMQRIEGEGPAVRTLEAEEAERLDRELDHHRPWALADCTQCTGGSTFFIHGARGRRVEHCEAFCLCCRPTDAQRAAKFWFWELAEPRRDAAVEVLAPTATGRFLGEDRAACRASLWTNDYLRRSLFSIDGAGAATLELEERGRRLRHTATVDPSEALQVLELAVERDVLRPAYAAGTPGLARHVLGLHSAAGEARYVEPSGYAALVAGDGVERLVHAREVVDALSALAERARRRPVEDLGPVESAGPVASPAPGLGDPTCAWDARRPSLLARLLARLPRLRPESKATREAARSLELSMVVEQFVRRGRSMAVIEARLRLADLRNPHLLRTIERFSRLREVRLELGEPWTAAHVLPWLATFPALRKLTLRRVYGADAQDALALRTVAHLESIVLELEGPPKPCWWAPLAAASNLTRLELSRGPLPPDVVHAQSLQHLELSLSSGLPLESARAIASLPRLRVLSLHAVELEDAGLEALAHAQGLEVLRLRSERRLSNDALAELPQLPRLRELSLRECPIDDAGLERVARSCPSLTELGLASCHGITGAGVYALLDCKRLRVLDLRSANGVSFDAIQALRAAGVDVQR